MSNNVYATPDGHLAAALIAMGENEYTTFQDGKRVFFAFSDQDLQSQRESLYHKRQLPVDTKSLFDAWDIVRASIKNRNLGA